MEKEQIIEYRRYFHQHPELGYNTQKTCQYIKNVLDNLGYETHLLLNDAAVIARLNLNKAKTIAFRSDMDALPIIENTDLEFKSINGCMHACGHDAHMAVLLGAAHLFMENKSVLNSNIVLIFQPAEEGPLPGGALPIIENYDFSNIDYFFAYHVTNKLHTGQIGIKPKEACAAPDLWECSIKGKGCHASTPHLGFSPILPAAKIISEFEKLHQELKKHNTVISTTYVNGGVSMNIIPDEIKLKGTARSFSKAERDNLKTQMQKIIDTECNNYHVTNEFDFHYAYDPVYNDEEAVKLVINAANNVLKPENVIILENPEMVGEDFSYYRRTGAKTCLTWLGVRGNNQEFFDLHNSKFLLDEEALLPASQILLNIAKANL